MRDFEKGDKVFVRDYPFGRPLRVSGIIVGILPDDIYSVKIESGLQEGSIRKYKYWKLYNAESKLYE